MELNTLSHRGIDAWLEGPDGIRLPFRPAVTKEGNSITAVIEVGSPGPTSYSVGWCKSPGALAINAWCEIFRPTGKKVMRIGNHTMDKEDETTQVRSSRGRLVHPFAPHARLRFPRSGEGFVSLEVRRLRGRPTETVLPDQNERGHILTDSHVDMVDDDEAVPPMPPHIVFKFNSELKEVLKTKILDRQAILAPKSAKQGGCRTHTREKRPDAPPRSKRVGSLPACQLRHYQEASSLPFASGSELSSPESDSEPLPAYVHAVPSANIRVDAGGESNPNDNTRAFSMDDVDPLDVDLVLEKRKNILPRLEKVKEETDQKRARRDQLARYLFEDTQAHAQKLTKEEAEKHQLRDEIERMEAAMHM
ncbi:hypothetical protein C8R46DRAFT_1064157 [Mycena filopes]|nr:hypothetical protein C8R46DRAFT_1064157 [Mycena filopes]